MANTRITLPSGRSAGLFAAGDPGANRLVVLCHPSAGSAAFDPDPTITARWRVHLIAIDRPGYGSSDPLAPGADHRLLERAQDVGDYLERVEHVADRVSGSELYRFGVIGWGTGGMLAAALAAQFPDRVDRLALVSAPAPQKAAKVARRAFIASPDLEALHIEDDDPDLARHLGLLGRVDRMIADGFLQGRAGVEADRLLMADDSWLDGLRGVRAATRIWLGRRDPVVDERDVEWWARHLGGARAVHVRDSGPLTVAAAWRAVLTHVAPLQGEDQQDERDTDGSRFASVDPVHPQQG